MQDLAVNENVGTILATAVADPKTIVGAICHGQASLLAAGDSTRCGIQGSLTDCVLEYGKSMGGLAANAPWLLEDRLRAAGALFEAGIPFGPHVVMDGNLITGQNPGSANAVTRAVLDLLAAR
jgi:putative intracellular protease/amidase